MEFVALADFEHVFHFFDARPRKIGDVRQAVESFYGNERAERRRSFHFTFDDLPDFDALEEGFFFGGAPRFLLGFFRFEDHALGSDDLLSASSADFDEFQTKRLADVFVKLFHESRANFSCGNENGIGSEFGSQTALVEARAGDGENAAILDIFQNRLFFANLAHGFFGKLHGIGCKNHHVDLLTDLLRIKLARVLFAIEVCFIDQDFALARYRNVNARIGCQNDFYGENFVVVERLFLRHSFEGVVHNFLGLALCRFRARGCVRGRRLQL